MFTSLVEAYEKIRRQAMVQALREAADSYTDYEGGDDEQVVREWLRRRAMNIELQKEPE